MAWLLRMVLIFPEKPEPCQTLGPQSYPCISQHAQPEKLRLLAKVHRKEEGGRENTSQRTYKLQKEGGWFNRQRGAGVMGKSETHTYIYIELI